MNMEDYKQAVINAPSDAIAEKVLAEANALGPAGFLAAGAAVLGAAWALTEVRRA